MTLLIAAGLVALLLAPHLLPQERLSPLTGASVWLAALVLRAVLALLLALAIVLYLPATGIFQLITHWCFHAALPLLSGHLGFSGHQLGDAATLVPTLILTFSALSAVFGIWRTARAVKRWLGHGSLGHGPADSVIVGGKEIVIAAAGLRSPRVVVSVGALTRFDDAELRAGLEHERGHISRHHRFIALVANLSLSLGRLLPGSRRAVTWLDFHLERDADAYALRRTNDPLALASAICKAARLRGHGPALAGLAGRGASERLRLLVSGSPSPSPFACLMARAISVGLATLTVALVLSAPTLTQAVAGQPPTGTAHQCQR